MFCFQCEQTAGCTGCTGRAGVCGKTAQTAQIQDELTGALVGFARAAAGGEPAEADHRLVQEGLFATLTNVNFDDASLAAMLRRAREAKERAASGRAGDYDMARLWGADEDLRSLKSLILFGLRGMAAYSCHARLLGRTDARVDAFFLKGLQSIADSEDPAFLLETALELGRVNFQCMELLDGANTDAYGVPAPTQVSRTVEKGPFILISGHDLKDLELLLRQTEGTGVNVYTHGEMLPAHGYPALKRYPHLKGHYGTAWFNQQKEFDGLPAPVLFTTNCLMPPKAGYRDRVFTTGVTAYGGMAHIGADKDFSPVVQKALELGGWETDRTFPGGNGGTALATGFGHGTVLDLAGQIVGAVRSGAVRHFFLVGGCDGARKERSYYTDFVKNAPADTLILTLGCGKFRFNDLDLGDAAGLPRLLDLGQCNDAYGAVRVALALADAFGCGINDLPLSLVLSWYEQKAVCILLSLLALGVKNILIGPTLPAFLSPAVLGALVERYGLTPVTTPEADLARLLG